ncbi:MAG: 50S ribosomal protein L29 [Parcubacteria group bacterium]|nr:50S ribosomal protein L29 [Parcubacteria group bacterium]
MKKNAFQELKNKSAEELRRNLISGRERLRGLKFDLAAGKVKNVGEIRETKKTIAKILTLINTK